MGKQWLRQHSVSLCDPPDRAAVPGAPQQKGISGDAVWWGQWEVDPREQLDCRTVFSNLLGQIAALPIPDVNKSQG